MPSTRIRAVPAGSLPNVARNTNSSPTEKGTQATAAWLTVVVCASARTANASTDAAIASANPTRIATTWADAKGVLVLTVVRDIGALQLPTTASRLKTLQRGLCLHVERRSSKSTCCQRHLRGG